MVSVVVPVYNTKLYLHECLDSIVKQTYQDLEILLIDDGSTDESSSICDAYAAQDPRIRVIHQENTGLAEVRNVGVSEAKGDWLMFVDSDDYIDENIVAALMEIQERTAADIVACGFVPFKDGSVPEKPNNDNISEVTFSAYETVKEMFSNAGIGWNAWCKLYRMDVFQNVKYPRGILCEDKATTYKTYLNAEKVVYTSRKLYYYRLRKNSIMGSRSKKQLTDTLQINENVCAQLKTLDDTLYRYACGYAAKSSFLYYTSVEKEVEFRDVRAICAGQMRKYYRYVMQCKFLPAYQRIIVWLAGRSVRKKDTGLCVRACASLLRLVQSRRG